MSIDKSLTPDVRPETAPAIRRLLRQGHLLIEQNNGVGLDIARNPDEPNQHKQICLPSQFGFRINLIGLNAD